MPPYYVFSVPYFGESRRWTALLATILCLGVVPALLASERSAIVEVQAYVTEPCRAGRLIEFQDTTGETFAPCLRALLNHRLASQKDSA